MNDNLALALSFPLTPQRQSRQRDDSQFEFREIGRITYASIDHNTCPTVVGRLLCQQIA
jgi:hypothetical protein